MRVFRGQDRTHRAHQLVHATAWKQTLLLRLLRMELGSVCSNRLSLLKLLLPWLGLLGEVCRIVLQLLLLLLLLCLQLLAALKGA